MRYRQAPADFLCPYRHACPHLDGLSSTWTLSVFREQWRLENELRQQELDNDQLRAENARLAQERDRIKAQYQALHRSQFKAAKPKPPAVPPRDTTVPKKRGPPFGHPPWNRPTPDHIDRIVPVAAPATCPHCQCDNLLPCPETVEHIQEDIVLVPRTHVTRFDHATAFCPVCRRPVHDTAPDELRHAAIGPVIARTRSFGSRSDHGAQAFALLASLLGTAKRQDRNPREFLQTLFTAQTATAHAALFRIIPNTS